MCPTLPLFLAVSSSTLWAVKTNPEQMSGQFGLSLRMGANRSEWSDPSRRSTDPG